MAASRTAWPLFAALGFGVSGCYTHYPYGSYSYGPWTPAYSTAPAAIAPGTVVTPGYESLGAPSTTPGGTYQPPTYGPSSYNDGDFYTPEGQESRKLVPNYDDPNAPGSQNTTPFGQ